MQTVGELRSALAECPDETPLGISTAGLGEGIHDCGQWSVELDGENGATICGE